MVIVESQVRVAGFEFGNVHVQNFGPLDANRFQQQVDAPHTVTDFFDQVDSVQGAAIGVMLLNHIGNLTGLRCDQQSGMDQVPGRAEVVGGAQGERAVFVEFHSYLSCY